MAIPRHNKDNYDKKRAQLFTGTFFAQQDIYGPDKKVRGSVKNELDFRNHLYAYFRLFAINYSNALDYIVAIPHDKDHYEKDGNGHKAGDVKKYHIHFVIKFRNSNQVSLHAMRMRFYDEFNVSDNNKTIHLDYVKDEGAILGYLTHDFQPNKTPYDFDEAYCYHAEKRTKGKVATQGYEDLGLYTKNDDDSYWVTALAENDVDYIGQGGHSEHEEIAEPDVDFDYIGQQGHRLGVTWPFSGKSYRKAEFRMTRQSGKGYEYIQKRRQKTINSSKSNDSTPQGDVPGGSSYYHGKLPLNKPRNHPNTLTEVEQIQYDISEGKMKYLEAEKVLKADYGALGEACFNKNKSLLSQALVNDTARRVRCINDVFDPMKRDLTVVLSSGDGGTGKSFISALQPRLLRPDLFEAEGVHNMISPGKKKTADLYKGWEGQYFSVGNEVNGDSFTEKEFNQVFDENYASPTASGRTSNAPFLPNFVMFTNSETMNNFVATLLIHSGKKYRDDDMHLAIDKDATKKMAKQIQRRIPFYQRFTQINATESRAELFAYYPPMNKHLRIFTMNFRTADKIEDDDDRRDEIVKVATGLCDAIKRYDWTGVYGHKRTVTYDDMHYYYDVLKDQVIRIDEHNASNEFDDDLTIENENALIHKITKEKEAKRLAIIDKTGKQPNEYEDPFLFTTAYHDLHCQRKAKLQWERQRLVAHGKFTPETNHRLAQLNYVIDYLMGHWQTSLDDMRLDYDNGCYQLISQLRYDVSDANVLATKWQFDVEVNIVLSRLYD